MKLTLILYTDRNMMFIGLKWLIETLKMPRVLLFIFLRNVLRDSAEITQVKYLQI